MSLIVRRLLVLLAATAALLLAIALGGAATARADTQYRFLHFNMCGNVCNHGEEADVAMAILRSIEDHRPHAVSLNEACYSQFAYLRSTLNNRGYWAMNGYWWGTKTTDWPYDDDPNDNECQNNQFGNALFVRHKVLLGPTVYDLPYPHHGEVRRMICAVTDEPRDTVFCTTHISNVEAYQDAQIKRVRDIVDPWGHDGLPIVLMGDFNVEPLDWRLDRIYDPDHAFGTGRFQEVDENQCGTQLRCGEPTWTSPKTGERKKLDYIFVNRNPWRAVSGDAGPSIYSDHDVLRGSAWLIH
jgi:endonuclease/exonuclease/phosphatase family metal-dependent hydrolase